MYGWQTLSLLKGLWLGLWSMHAFNISQWTSFARGILVVEQTLHKWRISGHFQSCKGPLVTWDFRCPAQRLLFSFTIERGFENSATAGVSWISLLQNHSVYDNISSHVFEYIFNPRHKNKSVNLVMWVCCPWKCCLQNDGQTPVS